MMVVPWKRLVYESGAKEKPPLHLSWGHLSVEGGQIYRTANQHSAPGSDTSSRHLWYEHCQLSCLSSLQMTA